MPLIGLLIPAGGQWRELSFVLSHKPDGSPGNAITYGAGRPIALTVRRAGAHGEIVVRDQGIGIAPEALSRIFERFERAASGRQYGGLGLGLWIVRQLVEAMDGSIRVESSLGNGSTFTVQLPIRAADPP